MIIYWKNHLNAYSGAHHYLTDNVKRIVQHIGVTPAVGGTVLISQSRGISRGIQSRIFGRVN